MYYEKKYHVWYSSCIDCALKKPDRGNKYYKKFDQRADALLYAHDIDKEITRIFGFGTEYGVMELNPLKSDRVNG